jgi:ribosomal protein L3
MAWVLAGMIGHLGPGQVTLRNGIISGLFAWLGFVATTLAVNNAYGRRTVNLTVIDAGHWLAVLLVQGAVIGAFGVR